MRRKCCSARFNAKLRHMHKTPDKPYLWLIFGRFRARASDRSLRRSNPGSHGLRDAIRENMDRMLRPSWGLRVMVYQGKVTYKKDPNLVAWGCPEVQTYMAGRVVRS